MNTKIMVLAISLFLSTSTAFAQMHHKQMVEFVSVCEKLADECSLGNKASCTKLKQHARTMRTQIIRMSAAEKGQMHDGDVIAEIQKTDPQLAENLMGMKTKKPSKFYKAIEFERESNLCIKPQMVKPDKTDIADMVKLNLKQEDIIEKYKTAKSEDEKESLKSELEKVLYEKYDIKTSHIKKKIKTAENRLDLHKENLKSRKRNKKEVIRQQVEQLLK